MQPAIDRAGEKGLSQCWSRTRKIIQCSHFPSWVSQCIFLGMIETALVLRIWRSQGIILTVPSNPKSLGSPFSPLCVANPSVLTLPWQRPVWSPVSPWMMLSPTLGAGPLASGHPQHLCPVRCPVKALGKYWLSDKKWIIEWLEGAVFTWTCSLAETIGTSALWVLSLENLKGRSCWGRASAIPPFSNPSSNNCMHSDVDGQRS